MNKYLIEFKDNKVVIEANEVIVPENVRASIFVLDNKSEDGEVRISIDDIIENYNFNYDKLLMCTIEKEV